MEQDAQPQFPVVPNAAFRVPRTYVLKEACAEEHTRCVEHAGQHLHARVFIGDESAHILFSIHHHVRRACHNVNAFQIGALHMEDVVVVEKVIAVKEVYPFSLARLQSFVACGCCTRESLSQQCDVAAVLDILFAKLVCAVCTLVVHDDNFLWWAA